MSRRRLFVAGNWKMNLNRAGAVTLARAVREHAASRADLDCAVFPPFVYLAEVAGALAGSRVRTGAQDLWIEKKGAFTGEVSAEMVRDCGGTLALVGHSERRHVIGEGDELVGKKVRAALDGGLEPVLCIGERLEERERAATEAVLERQFRAATRDVGAAEFVRVTVAYEPVWAIGTGRNATPAQAQQAHAFVRSLLAGRFGPSVAEGSRILYGGSVTPENASELLAGPDVDGVLVGGASLDAEKFSRILDSDRR
ncbi:MAG TPA: triose-phosphate isomerase [Planctomycetota bacterium]|nr:triose-phosphate isomerase [Planctomycetota bacterium]